MRLRLMRMRRNMKWREVRENRDILIKVLRLIGAGRNQNCMKKIKRNRLVLLAKASVARLKKSSENPKSIPN